MEQNTSNRVLNRMGARELSPEEVQHVAGGTTGCHGTSLHKNGPIVDVALRSRLISQGRGSQDKHKHRCTNS